MREQRRHLLLAFPIAALFNSFSMTLLLLAFGLVGRSENAADIGLVHGATLALFFAFSANARNLILADTTGLAEGRLLKMRLMLMLPIAGAAYFLSVSIGNAEPALAITLIGRRVSEWLGEIGLAKSERLGQQDVALLTMTGECLSLLACLGAALAFNADLSISAIPWACAPLLAARRARLSLRNRDQRWSAVALLPHFGATAIIGVSVYVFRISIALIAGKTLAGELFTAFAIGGLLPTIFGQALAPTLALRRDGPLLPRWMKAALVAMLAIGGAVFLGAELGVSGFGSLGRSSVFLPAVGLSIAGGVIMSVALAFRTRLIHSASNRAVFGADLLANVLIATSVPFVFHILGAQALAGLYALSACLSLVFMWRAGREHRASSDRQRWLLIVIGALLVLPVFFQINGALFRDPSMVFDTAGKLSRLPIPVSVIALLGGIALLANYTAAVRTLTTLFFVAVLFVLTSLSTAHGNPAYLGAKLILLAQFLLPMFALVLGEMLGASSQEPFFERGVLIVLALIIPVQLLSTWIQGYALLSPSLYLFSIYQHLQYLPMVVVALGVMVSFGLWSYATWTNAVLVVLLPLLAIHVVASQSISAVVMLGLGMCLFAYSRRRERRATTPATHVVLAMLVLGATYGVLSQVGWVSTVLNPHATAPTTQIFGDKFRTTAAEGTGAVVPAGVGQRIAHWRFYAAGVLESPRTFLLGHAVPPNRVEHPSAHNYWLDALYNFGILALLPLLILLAWTGREIWRHRREVSRNPIVAGTAIAAGYLMLIENMLKVGMREPYPGIVTYLIWGLLIARLRSLDLSAHGEASTA